MSKKIFFFDIDGTLCHRNIVSDRTKKAIEATQNAGHLCFIASGRPPTFIQQAIKDIPFDGYVLCNGHYGIYKNEKIINKKLDIPHLKEVCQFLNENDSEYILQTETDCYLHPHFARFYDFFKNIGVNVESFIREFDEEAVMKATIKIEILPKDTKLAEILKTTFPYYVWHHYNNYNMEVYEQHASKAAGIKQILDHLNIPFENTYCFGDGTNDLEMFEAVYHSYAMGNASDDVKSHAKYTCPSIEEDGVAVILESLLKNDQ